MPSELRTGAGWREDERRMQRGMPVDASLLPPPSSLPAPRRGARSPVAIGQAADEMERMHKQLEVLAPPAPLASASCLRLLPSLLPPSSIVRLLPV